MRNLDDFDLEHDDNGPQPAACSVWAALLPEAAEGLLSEAEARALDLHTSSCAFCERELAEARRGAAWLTLLKDCAPQPSNTLLENILAQTTGKDGAHAVALSADSAAALPIAVPVRWDAALPSPPWSKVLDHSLRPTPGSAMSGLRTRLARWTGVRQTLMPALQPRLAMTAAMAFLSICLTVNLLGISVSSLHAQSLRPAGLQRTVAGKGASLLRSFEGNRMVYRVESRVNEWLMAGGSSAEAPLEQSR